MKTVIRIFGVVVLVSLFFSVAPTTQGFMAFQHESKLGKNVLIQKVHAAQWRIDYRFTSWCPAEFRKEEERLIGMFTEGLRVWLQPLREISAKPIVDDFIFLRQEDFDGVASKVPAGKDARISFLCEEGFSRAHTSMDDQPEISMRRSLVVDDKWYLTIVHELGHAFGLADTYNYKEHHQSSGGLAKTRGTQPSSLMSGVPLTSPRRDLPYIKEDDRKGIIWLYKYFYENQLVEDCFFPDYVYEADPVRAELGWGGCRPKHPLIYEVTYGADVIAARILDQDPTLDINARDVNGRTALHYAVTYGHRWQVKEVLDKLLKRADIKLHLRDKGGKTAAELAKEAGYDDIAERLLAHPRALSVSPKGQKIAVTWGELKRGR